MRPLFLLMFLAGLPAVGSACVKPDLIVVLSKIQKVDWSKYGEDVKVVEVETSLGGERIQWMATNSPSTGEGYLVAVSCDGNIIDHSVLGRIKGLEVVSIAGGGQSLVKVVDSGPLGATDMNWTTVALFTLVDRQIHASWGHYLQSSESQPATTDGELDWYENVYTVNISNDGKTIDVSGTETDHILGGDSKGRAKQVTEKYCWDGALDYVQCK